MTRHVLLLVASWALLVSPNLCFAEVLTHPCGCITETDCGHEDDCADDPYHQLAAVVRTGRERGNAVSVPLPPVAGAPAIVAAGAAPVVAAMRSIPQPPPNRPNLPYAESDRPLRL